MQRLKLSDRLSHWVNSWSWSLMIDAVSISQSRNTASSRSTLAMVPIYETANYDCNKSLNSRHQQ